MQTYNRPIGAVGIRHDYIFLILLLASSLLLHSLIKEARRREETRRGYVSIAPLPRALGLLQNFDESPKRGPLRQARIDVGRDFQHGAQVARAGG